MAEADIDTVARIRVRGWRFAYAGLVPQPFLDALSPEEDAQRRRAVSATTRGLVTTLVAEAPAGEVTGWAALGPYREGDGPPTGPGRPGDDAELFALYVDPPLIGTGTGRALMAAALDRGAEHGFARMLLWVLRGNHRARRFYEAAGFVPDGREVPFEVAGAAVPEVRYVTTLRRRTNHSA